jgi:hypothetical protein
MNDARIAVNLRGECGDDLLNVIESLWGHGRSLRLAARRHNTIDLASTGIVVPGRRHSGVP